MRNGSPRAFVVLFFTVVLCGIGVGAVTDTWTSWRESETVWATVVSDGERFEDGTLYDVEYHGTRLETGGIGDDHKIGDLVQLRIDDLANPTEAKTNSDLITDLVVGVLFAIAGIAVAVFGLRSIFGQARRIRL
jgi:hypothetical protein